MIWTHEFTVSPDGARLMIAGNSSGLEKKKEQRFGVVETGDFFTKMGQPELGIYGFMRPCRWNRNRQQRAKHRSEDEQSTPGQLQEANGDGIGFVELWKSLRKGQDSKDK